MQIPMATQGCGLSAVPSGIVNEVGDLLPLLGIINLKEPQIGFVSRFLQLLLWNKS